MILIYGTVDEILGKEAAKNKKSAESAAGRALLDRLLSESGVAATSADIKIGKQGKPYLAALPNIDFNITHSNGLVACILSIGEGKVGIDAESAESSLSVERRTSLAQRFFADGEYADLESGKKSFSELWTRREAYLKMTGDGFAKGIKLPVPDNAHIMTHHLDGFILTVCTEKKADITVGEYNK